ncbi:MAG: hypothetical protein KKC51_15665 [Verrucomicrobia bacterium]|nr:hypothetical protein [Verrucomicrobiota bacterium]
MAPKKPGWKETLLGALILCVLAGVGAGLYREQSRFHPVVQTAGYPDVSRPAAPTPTLPSRPTRLNTPEGLTALGAPEFFGADTLYEKINGRAELYLPAGFQSLECRRFGKADSPEGGFEVFLYDMGAPRAAYSVFSVQQREGAESQDFVRFAYLAENALFFCHGRYYVEIIGAEAAASLQEDLRTMARRFVADTPAEPADLPELAWLPRAHRVGGTPRLYLTDGLGFQKLADLFVADYRIGEFDLSGFVAVQADAARAKELAKAYQKFLMDDGAVLEAPLPELPEARVISFFGTWQIIFTRGRFLGGVHQAGDRISAEQVALLLDRQLAGAAP